MNITKTELGIELFNYEKDIVETIIDEVIGNNNTNKVLPASARKEIACLHCAHMVAWVSHGQNLNLQSLN